MSTNIPEHINVRSVQGHVEVVGLNKEDVEYAICLYQEAGRERLKARSALASYVSQTVLNDGIELVSAASQRQIKRSAALRKELIQDQGAENYASLSELRESQESSVRTWVSRLRKRHELFTVEIQGQTLIPKVQLTDKGNINPRVTELVRPMVRAGLDGWSIWAWLTSPSGLLSGEVPAQVAMTNIKRASKAADRFAAELWEARGNVE